MMSESITSMFFKSWEFIQDLIKSDSFGYTTIIISLLVSRMLLTSEFVAFTALWGLLYLCLNIYWAMNYWKIRGVKHFKPWPIVGNMARVLKLEYHLAYYYDEIYNAFPGERMVGMYEFMTPSLVLRDTELIEQVLVKDFSTYPDHGPFLMEPKSILFESVFAMSGIRWRAIRNRLLTTFTTGKMRVIFPQILAPCQSFVKGKPKCLNVEIINELAVKIFMTAMFGINILPTGEEELMINCKRIFEPKATRILQLIFLTYFPKLSNVLNLKFMPRDLDDYFRSLMNTILDQRENIDFERNDYTKVLVEMRKQEKMNIYNMRNDKVSQTFDMTNEIALSQAFMFFFAGLDTVSLLILHLAFEFSKSKYCQDKARQEVRSVLKKFNGYSWEAVREMKYLEQCILETLRLHPSLQFLVRITDKDTELGGVKIKKNTRIVIPIHSIQMDPKNFTDPNKFDPERFNVENQQNKFAHLPFSDGPRVCLGNHLKYISIKNT
ncbi:unnamed protein product [Nezara viridula]|uniref:Cytochrome P450 n=1 Tax=Nezara viridula TaxID=85310 RepID=A0A9P0H548_NEZVI|nr:unnamed protein product [Nezara viridula]